jgi:hypothetical protein
MKLDYTAPRYTANVDNPDLPLLNLSPRHLTFLPTSTQNVLHPPRRVQRCRDVRNEQVDHVSIPFPFSKGVPCRADNS